MLLFRRVKADWSELFAHLGTDDEVPGRRDVALRQTGDGASEVALSESRAMFELELSGSGSLNARGTQLAGLTGATIALVATLAQKWLSSTNGATRGSLAGLIVAAMVLLFLAMYWALFAVLPTSRWRKTLAEALGADLGGEGLIEREALSRALAGRYLDMAEDQRARNQAKADDMLLAYGFLASGVVALLAASILFVGAHLSNPTTTTGRTRQVSGHGPPPLILQRGGRRPRRPHHHQHAVGQHAVGAG
jgi:hypothetical protein